MTNIKPVIIGIWVAAIISMVIGISFVQKKPKTIDHNHIPKEQIALHVPQTLLRAMNKEEYKKVEEYLKKNYPEGKILASSKNIIINFPKIESYYEWWAALHSAININPSTLWEIKKMCVGVNCKGSPLSATLAGKILEIQKEENKEEAKKPEQPKKSGPPKLPGKKEKH